MYFRNKNYRTLTGTGQIMMVLGLLGFLFLFYQNGQIFQSVFQKTNSAFFKGFFTGLSGALLGASIVFYISGIIRKRNTKQAG